MFISWPTIPIRYYTGVTGNLANRIDQHKHKDNPDSFTARYNVNQLVFYEVFDNIYDAINREKQIKGWLRCKKLSLIRSSNPQFKDLSGEL